MEILLVLLLILPITYKILFWVYTLQLKEYRFDRFWEFLGTFQGKKSIFNFLFPIELIILILSLGIFFDENFYTLVYPIVFYFLLIENVFVLGKIFRKSILKPKQTSRSNLLLATTFLIITISLYFILNFNPDLIYIGVLFSLIFPYLLVFAGNLILLPIIIHSKNKFINKAIEKSKNTKSPIKIGITGSYGKSSVKEFLCSILENEGNLLKTPENINSEMGVSSVVLKDLNEDYDYFVAEMGAYRIGEIALLGEIVNHKYAFLTAIGNQHIGLFGSIENTKKAKFEISKKVIENKGVLYLNYDNKEIRELELPKDLETVKYGLNNKKLDAKSEIIETDETKTIFNFKYKKIDLKLKTNLIGEHNILNITGIIAFCIDLGIDIEKIKKHLLNIQKPKNTLEIIRKETNNRKIVFINDSYNLSEQGLLAGIKTLDNFKGLEKILVMDDILELGKKAEKIHFEIGEKIAQEKQIDKIFFVGINYKKEFLEGLKTGGFKEKNILKGINGFEKDTVILFEGRKTKQIFDKLI